MDAVEDMNDIGKCLASDLDRYYRRLWGLARKLMHDEGDIEDLVQETFAHALSKEDTIGPVNGDLFGILSHILYHKYLEIVDDSRPTKKIYRPNDQRTTHYEDFEVFRPSTKATQETNVFAREVLQEILLSDTAQMRALAQIGFGATIREISVLENISHETAKNRVKKARMKLREKLDLRYEPTKRKFRGVYKHGRKWRASLTYKGTKLRLGTFENAEEAAHAFDLAAFSIGRRDTNLNFPQQMDQLATTMEALL